MKLEHAPVHESQTSMGYFDYYQRCIEQHRSGLKLVVGGTGLGKTRGVRQVVTDGDTGGRKLMYCANRVQLVQEMADAVTRRIFCPPL